MPIPILVLLYALGVVGYGLIGCALGVGTVAYHWRKLNRDEALMGLRKWENKDIVYTPSTKQPNGSTWTYESNPLEYFSWPAFAWPLCFVAAVGVGVLFAIFGVCYGPFWLCRSTMRYMASSLMSDKSREAIHAA